MKYHYFLTKTTTDWCICHTLARATKFCCGRMRAVASATLMCAAPIYKPNAAGKNLKFRLVDFQESVPPCVLRVHIHPWRDRANQCHHDDDDGCPFEHFCVLNTIFRQAALSLRHHHISLSPTRELQLNTTVSPTKTESVLEPRHRTNFPTNMNQSHKQYLTDCLLRRLFHVTLTKNN